MRRSCESGGLIEAFGKRGVVVHGANVARCAWLTKDLWVRGCVVQAVAYTQEPTLEMLDAAVSLARPALPEWVVARRLTWARPLLR